jgi:radical SAM protein with 4Fe4S-binding SPASM domain
MDGNVYACSQGQLVGNLNKASIEEIWNSEKIKELRQRLTSENYDSMCFNCPLFNNKKNKKNKKNKNDEVSKINFQDLLIVENSFFINSKKINYRETSYGFIDTIKRDRFETKITGWVMDQFKKESDLFAVLMVNNEYVSHSIVNIYRPDVAKALSVNYDKFGFEINAPFISIEKKIKLLIFNGDDIIGELYYVTK